MQPHDQALVDLLHMPTSVNRVLIVEDNVLIGLDAELLFSDIGVNDTILVTTVTDALERIATGVFDFALLDLKLGSEMAFPVANALQERNTPFAIASGYGDCIDIDDTFADVPLLTKPYCERDVIGAINASLTG